MDASRFNLRGVYVRISVSTAAALPFQHAVSKGANPRASRASASARLARISTISRHPPLGESPSRSPAYSAARWSAVSPPSSALFGSAPRHISASTTSACAHIAAAINGVRPCLFSASTLAPAHSKLVTVDTSPSTHAAKRGEHPADASFTSASTRRGMSHAPLNKNRAHVPDPAAHAARSGVRPDASGMDGSAPCWTSTRAASTWPW